MGFVAKIIGILFLFIGSYNSISATIHPHVFINTQITIVFDDDGIKGFEVEWFFDEMFSELMFNEYDLDSSKSFDDNEVKKLYKEAFINLKKFNYFTHIYVGNNQIDIKQTKNFKAIIKDGQMIYQFFIPIHIKATTEYKTIKIYPYDDTYYMDIIFSDNYPIRFKNNKNYSLSFDIKEDQNKAYYFNQIYPQVAYLKFKKK